MVEGSRGENHGELVGPLGGVAPATLGLIPEMAACQKAHHPLWEALPHRKTKVHLGRYVRRGSLAVRNVQRYRGQAGLASGMGEEMAAWRFPGDV